MLEMAGLFYTIQWGNDRCHSVWYISHSTCKRALQKIVSKHL